MRTSTLTLPSWRRRSVAFAGSLLALVVGLGYRSPSRAETIDFDAPDYAVGQRSPWPWTDENIESGRPDRPVSFSVAAGVGMGGSQALSVGYNPGYLFPYAVYQLPRPLTSADGAQRISVRFAPPANTYYNFVTYGSVVIGNGWMIRDSGSRRGITFALEDWHMSYPHHADEFAITSSGGRLGNFVPGPGQFYLLLFELDAAWTNMTFTVIPPSGDGMTNSSPWNGTPIDKVWLSECGSSGYDTGNAIYDDLVIGSGNLTPLPCQIVNQPQSPTNTPGSTATFTCTVQGSPPFGFRWRKGETSLSDGGNIWGTATPMLTVSNLTFTDAGDYSVVVTNSVNAVTSQVARLTVQWPPPVIVTQPRSQSLAVGGQGVFTVVASAQQPLSYRWQKDGADLTDNERLSGSTTTNLTVANLVAGDAGNYTVVVSDGLHAVTSAVAVLIVHGFSQLPAGLVALWSAEGNADDGVAGNHGTLANGVGFAPGHAGQAFSFDGATGKVSIPETPLTDLSRMSQWTVTAWIRPTSFLNASYPTIFSEGWWGASLGLERGTGKLESWLNNSNAGRSSSSVSLNDWSHVAMVYDGSTRTFYINGAPAGTAPAAAIQPSDSGCAIGDIAGGSSSSCFQGLIDEVAIFNTALTPAEVQQVFAADNSAVRLGFQRFENQIVLTWSRGTLQQAANVLGPWDDVPQASSPYTNTPTGSGLFFRIRVR